MISRYRHEIDNARAHIVSLWLVIIILSVFLAYAFHGWSEAPKEIEVHVPPDLSKGVVMRVGDVPSPNVYAFAFYIWQQINRWHENGAEDYPKNLYRFSPYITPRFRAELLRDMKQRSRHGELSGRVRALMETPGSVYDDSKVKQAGNGAWEVELDTTVSESVSGMEVKRTRVIWPLRVVRYDVDRERNPWGLALDGFAGEGPRKAKPDDAGNPRRS